MCILAVKQNGLALQFVINKTPQLIEFALQNNGLALQFVAEQTNDKKKTIARQNMEDVRDEYDNFVKNCKEE